VPAGLRIVAHGRDKGKPPKDSTVPELDTRRQPSHAVASAMRPVLRHDFRSRNSATISALRRFGIRP